MASAPRRPPGRPRFRARIKSLILLGVALALELILAGIRWRDHLEHPRPEDGRSLLWLVGSLACLVVLGAIVRRIPAAAPPLRPSTRRCSFCGKSPPETGRVIAGPGVFICARCLALCQAILERDEPRSG